MNYEGAKTMRTKDAINYVATERAKFLEMLVECKAKKKRLLEEEEELNKKIRATSSAIEELKKNIEQVPGRLTMLDVNGNKITDKELCPLCSKKVFYAWKRCSECGQRLDWSNYEQDK